MAKFYVQCTMIYNGTMEVDADSKDEALNIASDKLAEDINCVGWNFGEATADYADAE